MKRSVLLLTIIGIFLGLTTKAQFYTGLNTSQFGGVTNVNYNPAIADNPFIVDINIISMGLAVNNNYVYCTESCA